MTNLESNSGLQILAKLRRGYFQYLDFSRKPLLHKNFQNSITSNNVDKKLGSLTRLAKTITAMLKN